MKFVLLLILQIFGSSHQFDLFCDFDIDENLRADTYICKTIGLDIKSPNVRVTNVLGSHLENKTTSNVEMLYISQQSTVYLALDVHKFFPKLISFHAISSGLKFVGRVHFLEMGNLVELVLSSNLIDQLSDDVFNELAGLEILNLNQNRLSRLADAIFQKLISLKSIDLAKNRIEFINIEHFKFNTELENIDISENKLIKVDTKAFSHLTKLQKIVSNKNFCIDANSDEFDSFKTYEEELGKSCIYTCDDIANDLRKYNDEYAECIEELETVEDENMVIRNQEKACLLL